MKMSKVIFTLAGFGLTAALSLPAQADDQCPAGWTLTSVDKAARSQDARNVDSNQDQYVCERSTAGTVEYKDNYKQRDKDKDKPKDKDKDKPKDKDKGK